MTIGLAAYWWHGAGKEAWRGEAGGDRERRRAEGEDEGGRGRMVIRLRNGRGGHVHHCLLLFI